MRYTAGCRRQIWPLLNDMVEILATGHSKGNLSFCRGARPFSKIPSERDVSQGFVLRLISNVYLQITVYR